jgi:hypothetical protein
MPLSWAQVIHEENKKCSQQNLKGRDHSGNISTGGCTVLQYVLGRTYDADFPLNCFSPYNDISMNYKLMITKFSDPNSGHNLY